MCIGGKARWYAELGSRENCEAAATFAKEKNIPLIVLGSGSNTIFADGTIEALVVRIKAEMVTVQKSPHPRPLPKGEGMMPDMSRAAVPGRADIRVEAGKNLAMLINELAEENLDLSPLTGIPGTVGGAIFGNAGQGQGGVWISNYVKEVEILARDNGPFDSAQDKLRTMNKGLWKRFSKEQCEFGYRTSFFKAMCMPIIWSCTLQIPSRPKEEVKAEIERLLKKRIETQPHSKTAGSCFVSLPDGTPAWKVIDAAGLRGKKVGGVSISEKHANFLIAEKGATFEDAKNLIESIQSTLQPPLRVEMRLIGNTGTVENE